MEETYCGGNVMRGNVMSGNLLWRKRFVEGKRYAEETFCGGHIFLWKHLMEETFYG